MKSAILLVLLSFVVAASAVDHTIGLATVCDDATAEKISAGIVSHQLAGEIHIIPNVKSIYRQNDGQLMSRQRQVLLVKTRPVLIDELKTYLRQNLDLTDLVTFDITGGSKPYFEWLQARMKEPTPIKDPSHGEPDM
eukprot:TRINITY_DN36208_c0_g1_i1.p2 TRINITY_DN36208_c0_g1~~TRINITY_DN36208_c0_g1_i1.p2  ORF type:complete len:137 (-),score=26.51 TRINITY_DN36208_c0_g1_i1:128-538(-)